MGIHGKDNGLGGKISGKARLIRSNIERIRSISESSMHKNTIELTEQKLDFIVQDCKDLEELAKLMDDYIEAIHRANQLLDI